MTDKKLLFVRYLERKPALERRAKYVLLGELGVVGLDSWVQHVWRQTGQATQRQIELNALLFV